MAKFSFNVPATGDSVPLQSPVARAGDGDEVMNFEDVLEKLGGFGRFQLLILVLLLAFEIPTAFLAFVPVFVGVPPKTWICRNNTLFNSSSPTPAIEFEVTVTSKEVCDCGGEFYSNSDTSIVSEWNLECDKFWVSDFITSFQMFGTLFGNLYTGSVSDWYGRKYTFLCTSLLSAFGQSLSALAPNPYVFALARFLSGAGLAGYIGLTAIYTMEFHTPQWRPLCGSVGPWGEGVMLLGLLAYLIRPWRSLIWACTVPYALILVIFPFVPESPRWLLRQNRVDEAWSVTNFIGKINGKSPGLISKEMLQEIANSERASAADGENDKVRRMTYLDLFRNRDLRATTIYLMIIWLTWSLTYFGISYNIKNMAGNPYINVILLGATDALGYPSSLLINNRIGRRKSVAFFMSWATFFLVSLAVLEIISDFADYQYLVLGLCLVGKFGIAGVRGAARTLVGESYPTSCRSMGSGLSGVAASLGGIIAPQLAFLGSRWPSLPYLVFAVMSICGVIVSFLLSETMGQPMKEEQDFSRKKSHRNDSKKNEFVGGSELMIELKRMETTRM